MEEKYIKFYKTFHKKFKNDKNLILCSNPKIKECEWWDVDTDWEYIDKKDTQS